MPLEPGIACFKPNVRDVLLSQIPLQNGIEDITRLPLPYPAEEILLVAGHQGRVTLANLDEQYTVTLVWDRDVFPACQLWLSNGGRQSYPWNRRFLALGIEPVRAAFDYGTLVSRNRRNPLWQAGLACVQAFSPERPFETEYSIADSPRQS